MMMSPEEFANFEQVGFSWSALWSSFFLIGPALLCLCGILKSMVQVFPQFRTERTITACQAAFLAIIYLFTAPLLAAGSTKTGLVAYLVNKNMSAKSIEALHDLILSTSLWSLLFLPGQT